MTPGALGVIDRPVRAGDLPFIHQRCLLMSTNPGDAPLLSGLYGEEAAAASIAIQTAPEPESVVEPCGGDGLKTRLEK